MDDWEQVKLLMRSIRNGVPDVTAITGREGVSLNTSCPEVKHLQQPSVLPPSRLNFNIQARSHR